MVHVPNGSQKLALSVDRVKVRWRGSQPRVVSSQLKLFPRSNVAEKNCTCVAISVAVVPSLGGFRGEVKSWTEPLPSVSDLPHLKPILNDSTCSTLVQSLGQLAADQEVFQDLTRQRRPVEILLHLPISPWELLNIGQETFLDGRVDDLQY